MPLSALPGPLGKRRAAHLLRRCTFNVTISRIEAFAQMTANEAVDQLLNISSLMHPEGPVSWIDGVSAWLTNGQFEETAPDRNVAPRRRAVWVWIMNEALNDLSIRHKMAFFWHSIFVTELDSDWREFFIFRLFQKFAVGNIERLSVKATLDCKMLNYLNNNTNEKGQPNENYAREFLELFTILKGATIDTGNYTNFTEEDIVQAARVLTGFKDFTIYNVDPETGFPTGRALLSRHDQGNKTFSAAFNHKTIFGASSEEDMFRELEEFVAMIFEKEETARAFVRRIYRYFVSDRLGSTVEKEIIEPLSKQLYKDNYDLENTLKILFTSKHFFDEDDQQKGDERLGAKIKSPLELLLSSVSLFDANLLGNLSQNPIHYQEAPIPILNETLIPMGFSPYPLSVEGYPGYYKAPNYSKFWFDQSTIAYRYRLARALVNGTAARGNRASYFKVDVVAFFDQNFQYQEYADQLVKKFLEITLPVLPDTDRFNYFLQKLLGDLSPVNWMFEWQNYKQTGDDDAIKIALEELFEAVVGSPEYQTF